MKINVENKETWEIIIRKLINEGISEEDDIILFGSSLYEKGNDFDLCIVLNNFYNIQYLINKLEHIKKSLEEEIKKNIDFCYLLVGDIENFVKNSMIYNLIIRTGISIYNVDYSRYHTVPNMDVYNKSDSRLRYSENIISDELKKEHIDWNLIEKTKKIIIKEISVRMSIDKNINGYDLYLSYKRFQYLLEKIDLNNILTILDEVVREGEGLVSTF